MVKTVYGILTGNTEVIQNPNMLNLDYKQIQGDDDALFGEGVAMEVTVEDNLAGFLEPKVTFEDMAHYSRYRYESERSKTPRSSKNKISDPADDYKSLGIVKV